MGKRGSGSETRRSSSRFIQRRSSSSVVMPKPLASTEARAAVGGPKIDGACFVYEDEASAAARTPSVSSGTLIGSPSSRLAKGLLEESGRSAVVEEEKEEKRDTRTRKVDKGGGEGESHEQQRQEGGMPSAGRNSAGVSILQRMADRARASSFDREKEG